MSNQADNDRHKASDAAKALGRLGGLKGGKARAAAMTPEQRSEAARKAVQARWAKQKPKTGLDFIKSRVKWNQDIKLRKDSFRQFARICGKTPDDRYFVWSRGPYIVFHFDLITISPHGEIDRSEVYDAIKDLVLNNHGARLSESTYFLPLLKGKSSRRTAAEFWNRLSDDLRGMLAVGDKFFIHYTAPATRILSDVGGIGQVVGENRLLRKTKITPNL